MTPHRSPRSVLLAILVALCLSMAGMVGITATAPPAQAAVMSSGWHEPLSPMPGASTGFMASSCNGGDAYLSGQYHIGVDYGKAPGQPVYAIGDGTVIYVDSFGTGWGNAVFIQHKAADGSDFVALYGHVNPTVANGSTVVAGQQVATIADISYDHLHFGIRPGTGYPQNNWGMMPCSSWAGTNGFVDPMPYLNAHPMSGGTTSPPPPADSDGDGTRDDFDPCPYVAGESVAIPCPNKEVAGDFNNDGFEDMAVLYDYGRSNTAVFVSYGAATGGLTGFVKVWESGIGNFGWQRSKPVAGDFNRDGLDDLAVLYDYDEGNTAIFLFAGSHTGLTRPVKTWESGKGQFSWRAA